MAELNHDKKHNYIYDLQVGNQDSLVLYGSNAQRTLREVSRNMASIILDGNADIENTIYNVLEKLEESQSDIPNKKLFGLFPFRKSTTPMKYGTLLSLIDELTLALQIQEAALLKNIAMMRRRKIQIDDAIDELGLCIRYGRKQLEDAKQTHSGDGTNIDSNISLWISRLEKKIEDLLISQTVSLQTQAQLELLIQNQSRLVDQIIAILSSTIPVWRNQITLIMGEEQVRNQVGAQKEQKLDANPFNRTNALLQEKLKDLLEAELKNKQISQGLQTNADL